MIRRIRGVAEAITCERLARVSTGPVKALCFVPPHGKLYVARLDTDSVTVVDCATNQISSTFRTANTVPVMQYNSLNDRLYCGGSLVSVVDCSADTMVRTIATAASVFAFDSVNNKLYAGSDGPLSVIDCAPDSVVAAVPEVDSATALCFNPTAGKVYAVSDDTLYAIRTDVDSIVGRLRFGGLTPQLACDPERNRIYYAYGGNLGSIDCAVDTVVLAAYTGVTPSHVVCDVARNRLLVTYGSWNPVVDAYDAASGSHLSSVTVNGLPSGVGWCAGLDRLYCHPQIKLNPPIQSCLLSAVTGACDSIAGVVPLTMYAGQVTLDTVHNRLYFVYPRLTLGCIGAVDCSQNIVTWYKPVAGAEAACYNPNNNRLYWGIWDDITGLSAVMVYDCAAESVVKRVPVYGRVIAFRLRKDLNKLYAATDMPAGLCILDCKYDSLVGHMSWPDDYPGMQLLVPGDNRYWYLGPLNLIVVDCLGDTVVANIPDTLGSIDDACACSEERKIYTSEGQVIDMDKPKQVDLIEFWGSRFCYVPGARKLYACTNDHYNSYFLVLDTRSDTVTARFNSPCQVSGMCLDRTGEYIYCAGYEDSMMLVISARDDSIVATFRVTSTAAARDPLAANRRTNRIYEAGYAARNGIGIPVVRDSMLIGLEDLAPAECGQDISATVVSRNAPLRTSAPAELYDASGRGVVALREGQNDVSRLAPGVYFLRKLSAASSQHSGATAVHKLVIAR